TATRSRAGPAAAAAATPSPSPLPIATTSSAGGPKVSSRSSEASGAGRVAGWPRGSSSTERSVSRSRAACRWGGRWSPRRTKESDPRWRRWGGSCAGRDPGSGATAHDPVLDGHGDLGQVGGGGPRQHLAVGGIEAGAVAGADQLHLVLAQCAAIVGAVPGVGGDVLAAAAHQEGEGLLAAEIDQGAGVLGDLGQIDLAVLGADRLGGPEALALRRATSDPSDGHGGGGQHQGTATGQAGAFHLSRIGGDPGG